MNTSQINFGLEPHGKTRYEKAVAALLRARREGDSLREAAEAAGVHVATVCRWQNRDPALREALSQALQESLLEFEEYPRPSVRWRHDCPLCKAKVVVRTAHGKAHFWRCGRWPECPWASWRPRASRDCRRRTRCATGPTVA